ncbi:MAG: AsnC family transcriptional regulator [Halobacteriales archaeon]
MAQFDETDIEILQLLAADGRRPYSDIAEAVDLSPPAVSDRIERLREEDIIRRITVDLDRSKLTGGVEVLMEVRPDPDATDSLQAGLADRDEVEHVFATADARVFAKATVNDGDVRGLLADAVDLADVREYDVHLLTAAEWTPGLGAAGFDIECDECGNTVTEEGETATLDGTRYYFCCPSCEQQFVDRYERLEADAD